MYKNKPLAGTFGTRNILIISCAVLLLLLVVCLCVCLMLNRTGDMASRENIEARLDEIGEEDLGHRYVARHLREYGVGKFDAGKLRRIENYFRNEYPGKLPSEIYCRNHQDISESVRIDSPIVPPYIILAY